LYHKAERPLGAPLRGRYRVTLSQLGPS